MAQFHLEDTDPVDRAFIRMIEMNHKKRADYAGADPFANFRKVAEMMQLDGYDHIEDCMTMVCRKIARINNLRGRDAQNEAVIDSFEDLAVYGMLLFAMVLERADHHPGFVFDGCEFCSSRMPFPNPQCPVHGKHLAEIDPD